MADLNNSDVEDDNTVDISKSAALCFLNDLRYALIRQPGDVTFKLPKNEGFKPDKGLENSNKYNFKDFHSTIFTARSPWFHEKYLAFRHDSSKYDEFNYEHESGLKITADVTENEKLLLQIDGVNFHSFQEFSKLNIFYFLV